MSKQPNGIFAEVRHQELLTLVNTQGRVLVNDLCEKFDVSPATIRKDLNELERMGLLKRVHGGALSLRESSALELTSQEKVGLHATKKRAIAQLARKYVKPGKVIAIDSGTTTMELAKAIADIPSLTVITNDLKIALFLEENSEHNLIFLGGAVRKKFHCTAGNMVLDLLDSLHIDTLFLATNAMSLEWGLSTPNIDMANIKRTLMKNSRHTILLADSSKVGGASLARFATMGSIFSACFCGIAEPRVGLLNVGREPGKGTALHQEAYEKLAALPIRFVGNVEGSDLVSGYADVVVSDGFSGNILLKSTEAAGKLAIDIARQVGMDTDPALTEKIAQAIWRKLEFNSQGAATFLGTKKIVVKMHGCANKDTTVSSIRHIIRLQETGFLSAMAANL